MKDLRGTRAAQVRNTIFHYFRLLMLKSNNRKKNVHEVLAWKKSEEVYDAHVKLFEDDVIHDIAKQAFSLDNVDENDNLYFKICIYTAAICDIILNPDYPDVKCSKKPLQLRLRKFKVIFFT